MGLTLEMPNDINHILFKYKRIVYKKPKQFKSNIFLLIIEQLFH